MHVVCLNRSLGPMPMPKLPPCCPGLLGLARLVVPAHIVQMHPAHMLRLCSKYSQSKGNASRINVQATIQCAAMACLQQTSTAVFPA